MRLLFLILLIINVLVGVFVWQSESGRASIPAVLPLPELAPARIRTLSPDDAKRRPAKSEGPAEAKPAEGAPNAGSAVPDQQPPEPVAKAEPVRACMEWGAFRNADVPRATRLIEGLNMTVRAIEQRVEGGPSSYWVYIPPLPSRRQAELRISQLKPTRIDDYYVVLDEGRYANAISLGVFSTEAGARSRREALSRLGVADAVVGPRESGDARTFLRMRNVPEQMVPRLIALRGTFAGTELRDCSGEAARGG